MRLLQLIISLSLFILLGKLVDAQENISLSGQWEIIFDPENEGREDKWMLVDHFNNHPKREPITVPSAWETIRQDYEGVAFYGKQFDIPNSWEGKVIRLKFGAVNYLTEVWLNDEVVGYHEGGFTPFEFRVDKMIKVGESNYLILRVVGPIMMTDQIIDGMGKLETPQWRGGLTAGIWQPVELVATDEVYLQDVYIETDFAAKKATFHINLDHTALLARNVFLDIKLTEKDAPDHLLVHENSSWKLVPGINQKSVVIDLAQAKYWSPDSPNLYNANIQVSWNDTISDRWQTNFGLRELTIKDKDFYFNGKPIYLKAAFFEGLYPNGIAYPDSEEMIRREIQLAKDAGFNMIRPWRRPPAPIWLDVADEMGMLVVASPALECMTLPLSTPYLPHRVENEVRSAVLRDRSRTCIVQWELFNELHRPVLKQLMRPMAMLTRQLDPTRLILDESGGWAFGANMYLPRQFEPTKFNDIHNYAGPFINKSKYDGYLSIGMTQEEKKKNGISSPTPGRNVVPGLMSYVSELGYGSLPDLVENIQQFEAKGNPLTPAYRYHKKLHEGQQRILREAGFEHLYPDMQQYYRDQQQIHGSANKRMIEAVRANPEVDGYCIHALCAGDWIAGAGLIDIWRNPKTYAYTGTKAANQPRIVSIRINPHNVYADSGFQIQLIGINDLQDVSGELLIEIKDTKGKIKFTYRAEMVFHSGLSTLHSQYIKTKGWKGEYLTSVKILTQSDEILVRNNYAFNVFNSRQLKFPRSTVAVIGYSPTLRQFLKKKGLEVREFSPDLNTKIPVLLKLDQHEDLRQSHAVRNFIKRGGTVIFLRPGKEVMHLDSLSFPFTARVHPAQGLWTCIPHLVKAHPCFDDLPVNAMMNHTYENVWPNLTLRGLVSADGNAPDNICASLGFDWFSREHKLQYSGPGDAWWGSDVAVLPFGEGKCVISQMRLVEHLGKDPVADKILANLITFSKQQSQ